MAKSTGSLIEMHIHLNKEILDALSKNKEGQLLFEGKLIDSPISEKEDNAITREKDGLYVDGSIIKDFSYVNGVLKYKDITVSQEYDEKSIKAMIYELWKQLDDELGDNILSKPNNPNPPNVDIEIAEDDVFNFVTADNKVIVTTDGKVFSGREI